MKRKSATMHFHHHKSAPEAEAPIQKSVQVPRLAARLLPYISHHPTCHVKVSLTDSFHAEQAGRCTCGLTQLLSELS